jgi:hypothetical protein
METLNKHDIYFTEADISLEIFDSVMPPCPVSFRACNAEQCVEFQERVMSFYSEYKKLWEENKGVKIKWMENTNSLLSQIKLLEFHNEQKQRFLDKQTHLVETVSREKGIHIDGIEGIEEHTRACDRCFHHRDMWRMVRSMNLEQQKRCEIESMNVRSINNQQGKQLLQIKLMYSSLQARFKELQQKKDDPFCRDSEILKLRRELEDSKAMTAGFNKTAFNANNEARSYMHQLEEEKAHSKDLRAEVSALESDVLLHKEIVDVLRQTASPECLEARQLYSIGDCDDLVCRNRQLAVSHKINMLTQQIGELRVERDYLQEDVTRARGDIAYWRKLACDSDQRKECTKSYTEQAIPAIVISVNEPLPVQQTVVQVIEQKSKPLISVMGPGDDITMRMQSLFEVVMPVVGEELDENDMYDAFMLDQEPHSRKGILKQMFASCHNGENLSEDEKTRFKTAVKDNNNSIRSCKRSFSACLRAIGGVMRKKRSRNIWLNFRQTREPIFKWGV